MPCVTSMAVMSRISTTKSASMEGKRVEDSQENICVVCFKGVELYSIGQCDHPVCYECSTRMRVLCKQNECPICRQDMPMVVFTNKIRLFKEFKTVNSLMDKKFKIAFDNEEVKTSYFKLLEHSCPKCPDKSFGKFSQLRDHVRRVHQLNYCELCVDNLKIFTFERRVYSRSELVQHKKHGDADDKSHKGHPLCEFCDVRYMDNDERYRHLRRDHLYCHFCDADGYHRYYSSYGFLRDHFRKEHFLCEEGECAEEQFTSVFRTEIDLKAHRASAHGRAIGKFGLKQARTLELEFTLAPRSSSSFHIVRGVNNRHQHHHREEEEDFSNIEEIEEMIGQANINTDCIEEFPCLGGGSSSVAKAGPAGPLATAHRPFFRNQSGRLTINDENFPALSQPPAPPPPQPPLSKHSSVSTRSHPPTKSTVSNNLKQAFTVSASVPSKASSKHQGNSTKGSRKEEFPALSCDFSTPCTSQWAVRPPEPNVQVVKIPQAPKPKSSASFKMDSTQFPSLQSESAKSQPPPVQTSKKNKQNKPVTPSPPQPELKTVKEQPPQKKSENKGKKKNQKNGVKRDTETESKEKIKGGNSVKNNNCSTNGELPLRESDIGTCNSIAATSTALPPPGFAPRPATTQPPPGLPLPPPGLVSPFPVYSYLPPNNFTKRNKKLLGQVVKSVGDELLLDEFKRVSSGFRNGSVSGAEYLNHCSNIMGQSVLDSLFPELLALLPDITKQQELWRVVDSRLKNSLEECSWCGQVVAKGDLGDHTSCHAAAASLNFPPLSRPPTSIFTQP